MESSAGPVTPPDAASASGAIDQRDRNIALVSIVLLLVGMPIAYLTDNPSTGDVIGLFAMLIVSFALMAAFFLWLIPRERAAGRASRTALIMSIAALVTGVVFWTGLPFPIGAAAVALGLGARDGAAGAKDTRATAGALLGAVVVLASFVLLLIG